MNENINININFNTTMSRMNDLTSHLHVDIWEFYNFLMSKYDSIETRNPSFHNKLMEGYDVAETEDYNFGFDYDFEWNIPQYDAKPNTKRYDIRDKAKAGHKGKKINDWDGKHWNRVYVTNPKKEKAMKNQMDMDLQCMDESKESDISDIIYLTDLFYFDIENPTTKTYEQVLSEVYNKFDFIDFDSYILGVIADIVLDHYRREAERVSNLLHMLRKAVDEAKAAEERINIYANSLSKYGIDIEV